MTKAERIERAIALYQSGFTMAETGQAVERSAWWVYDVFKRHGIQARRQGRAATGVSRSHRYAARKASGKCVRCMYDPPRPNRVLCQLCADFDKVKNEAAGERRAA